MHLPIGLVRLLRRLLLWMLERLPEDEGSLLAHEAPELLPEPQPAAVAPVTVAAAAPLAAIASGPPPPTERFRVTATDTAGHIQMLYAGPLGAKARQAYEFAYSPSAQPIVIEFWDATVRRGHRSI